MCVMLHIDKPYNHHPPERLSIHMPHTMGLQTECSPPYNRSDVPSPRPPITPNPVTQSSNPAIQSSSQTNSPVNHANHANHANQDNQDNQDNTNHLHERYITNLAGAAIAEYQVKHVVEFGFLQTAAIHTTALELMLAAKSYLTTQSLENANNVDEWIQVILLHKPIQLVQRFIYLLWATNVGNDEYKTHCFNQGQRLFDHFKKDINATF